MKISKKLVIVCTVVIVTIAAGVGVGVYVWNSQTKSKDAKKVAAVEKVQKDLQKYSVESVPDDAYLAALTTIASKAQDKMEQALLYLQLADSSMQRAKNTEALDAYKKAKALENTGAFTAEQKRTISNNILALEFIISENKKPSPKPGYGEPK